MSSNIKSVIVGTGNYTPSNIVSNSHFLEHNFYEKNGEAILRENSEIISKFQDITEIEERRYADPDHRASDLGYLAALDALESSKIDPETLDYVIVAHNFGDIAPGSTRPDVIPTLGSRIKHKLGIKNPDCVAYDLPFGCPGWLQGMIQADYFIRSGDAKRILVIGTETLSRVTDPHDRDSMIFADGAGATILEAQETNGSGILSHKTQTHTFEEAYYLYSDKSSNPDFISDEQYIKMDGRKIYEYALKNVPLVIQQALQKSGTDINEVKKVLVHQANGKMDEAILKRLFKLYGVREAPHDVMPMTISTFGNSSVATIPTLLDLIMKNQMKAHTFNTGDRIALASVGAGMNINAMVYQF
ncbi:3-oxoacyl-ACP synthase III family protein [Daejeonella lutea]|uniref:3-oxoacyl-[acyl-carrier-protein] synthase-3 n=1 Tax=Daejeonella lutea TaxID=572036 RepID=A0A1T5DN92_9SPHI|nr:ketoacyl-ACP synthase III [Daejeonella lutea]SKB73144.1 3-oxoacyl-[acyl-carrier-protein] synthase-3 [Daejeonella lutea]